MDRKSSGAFRSESILGFSFALFAFLVYLTTLAPSLGFTDAGELAAVAATFGIAHPTGYPLFTLLAGAFARLPLGETVIWRLNLFAALCAAASIFFFFGFFAALLRDAATRAGGATGERAVRVSAAAGALTLAFSRTFWEQATGVEVYSLHMLMVSLVLYFFVKAGGGEGLRGSAPGGARGVCAAARRAWILFAFCLGLSFANHMTTVLLLPALAFGFFAGQGFGKAAWARAARAVPPFLAGLSLYLYLPLRAAAGPALNWGNPVDGGGFLRHVSGRQYSVWMFSSLGEALAQLKSFAAGFPGVFGGSAGFLALALMAAGLASLARSARRLLGVIALLFLACVLYAVNYSIHDISNYYLVAHVAACLALACGVHRVAGRFAPRRAATAAALLGALVVLPALAANHKIVDERGNYAVEDYARNLFASLEPNAVLLTYQWDHFVSASYYLQLVERHRPDVVVLEQELLRRSWYLAQLERTHPGVIAGSRREVAAFLDAVRPFERGEAYDAASIQAAYEGMIVSMLHRAARLGPVYAGPEIDAAYLAGFRALPSGLALRLYPAEEPPPRIAPPAFVIRPLARGAGDAEGRDALLFVGLRRHYAAAYVNRAYVLGAQGDLEALASLLDDALAVSPGYGPALELRRRLDGLR